MIETLAIPLVQFLSGVFGKTVGNKLGEVAVKSIERHTNKQLTEVEKAEINRELLETTVNLQELDLKNMEMRGKFIQAFVNAMPLIAWILPIGLGLLIFSFNVQFWIDVAFSLIGHEAPIIHIDDRYVDMMITFIKFLLGSKAVGKLSPWHDSSSKDYGNSILNVLYK